MQKDLKYALSIHICQLRCTSALAGETGRVREYRWLSSERYCQPKGCDRDQAHAGSKLGMEPEITILNSTTHVAGSRMAVYTTMAMEVS
jgi:hypothetical protein